MEAAARQTAADSVKLPRRNPSMNIWNLQNKSQICRLKIKYDKGFFFFIIIKVNKCYG